MARRRPRRAGHCPASSRALLQDRERALRHAAHTYASGHTIFDAIASGGGGLVATLVIEAAFLALLRR
ncbi:hypothetical protein [Nocardia otitidiscaviarum]|uniref:hypothetical protein n=1 Tax=Nocardia otitidiscaviarum TaxID=1823 RepID=UPI0002E34982|nr:hypothetical protein [Nocardia otitidiscaviarum]